MINEYLRIIRLTSAIILFTYASWSDWKYREIDDKIWMIMTLIGLISIIIELTTTHINSYELILMIISIALSFTIGFTLFYLDLFGGADSKALMALSILIPTSRHIGLRNYNSHPIIPLAMLNNSIILSLSVSILILIKNLIDIIEGEKIFEEIENINLLKKILIIITSYRIPIEKLRSKKFIYPIEEISIHNGKIKRQVKIRIGISFGEEELEKILEYADKGLISGKIWVTPGLPMIIFIFLGFIISILFGDLIFMLILWIRVMISS